mmetsp:Transcript_48558/g.152579  ORF Transcript_48558/g.152579 Transcript_48558/m.152579 type:complete len:230 (-) Transcript_48558:53-742(-)
MPPPPFFPVATESWERDVVTEVLPGKLFVTNWRGASDRGGLLNLGVTHIAAIGDEFTEDQMEGMVHHTQNIMDNAEEAPRMMKLLRETSAFIDGALRAGGCVLVHCAAGASRSATVVLAYLVLHAGMTLRAAFVHLWGRRPATWPNDGFMSVLIGLESEHARGQSTLTMAEYEAFGEWEGPMEGEAPPLPVLMRLNRQATCLDTEQRLSAAAEEERLSQLASKLDLDEL